MSDISLQEIAGMIESKISRERLDAVEQFIVKYNIALNTEIYLLDKQDDFNKGVKEGLAKAKELLEQMQELCKNTLRA